MCTSLCFPRNTLSSPAVCCGEAWASDSATDLHKTFPKHVCRGCGGRWNLLSSQSEQIKSELYLQSYGHRPSLCFFSLAFCAVLLRFSRLSVLLSLQEKHRCNLEYADGNCHCSHRLWMGLNHCKSALKKDLMTLCTNMLRKLNLNFNSQF